MGTKSGENAQITIYSPVVSSPDVYQIIHCITIKARSLACIDRYMSRVATQQSRYLNCMEKTYLVRACVRSGSRRRMPI